MKLWLIINLLLIRKVICSHKTSKTSLNRIKLNRKPAAALDLALPSPNAIKAIQLTGKTLRQCQASANGSRQSTMRMVWHPLSDLSQNTNTVQF